MSSKNGDAGGETEERRSDLAVMESNEYKLKRRLQRVLDARDKVETQSDRAYELWVRGEIEANAKNIMLLRAVREFVREGWQLLLEHAATLDRDEPSEYLSGRELGQIEFQHEDREPIVFEGLYDILHRRDSYRETWTEREDRRHQPSEAVEYSQIHTIPEPVCWEAYLLMCEFLATEHDIKLQFEEVDNQLPSWGYLERDPSEVSNGDDLE